jgi:hypothetical protein
VQYLPDVAALWLSFFFKLSTVVKYNQQNAIKFSVVLLFVFDKIILKGGKVSRLWLDAILDNEMFFYWN